MENLSSILYKSITDEVRRRLDLPEKGLRSLFLEAVMRKPLQRFTALAARFDQLVAEYDFCTAAKQLLPVFIRSLSVNALVHIPQEGPLLMLANHPGVVDSLILPACIQRRDLKIVTTHIPFFASMPSIQKYLILVPQRGNGRLVVVREVLRHLSQGGAVLLFPGGRIEPDPGLFAYASSTIEQWSESIALFLRRAPQCMVQIAIVSGIVARECLHHPISLLGKTVQQRQLVAEFIQVMGQMMHKKRYELHPRVLFSEPLEAWRMVENTAQDVMVHVIGTAQSLVERLNMADMTYRQILPSHESH